MTITQPLDYAAMSDFGYRYEKINYIDAEPTLTPLQADDLISRTRGLTEVTGPLIAIRNMDILQVASIQKREEARMSGEPYDDRMIYSTEAGKLIGNLAKGVNQTHRGDTVTVIDGDRLRAIRLQDPRFAEMEAQTQELKDRLWTAWTREGQQNCTKRENER